MSSELTPNNFAKCKNRTKEDDFLQRQVSCTLSKLRRLKMQEHLLSNSGVLNSKDILELINYQEATATNRYSYLLRVRTPYLETKKLFENIKQNVDKQECLKLTDIDDIKQDVFNLDISISSLKNYLQKEMNILKTAEIALHNEVLDDKSSVSEINEENKLKVKAFNKIVPSPVKAIINSPYKIEIQRLQDFFKENGRYGGWSEHYHNAFLKSWQKYKGERNYIDLLIEELLQLLPDITLQDILNHDKWHSRMVVLKNDQKQALERWKERKKVLKNQQPAIQTKVKKTISSNRSSNKIKMAVQFKHNEETDERFNIPKHTMEKIEIYDTDSTSTDSQIMENDISHNTTNDSPATPLDLELDSARKLSHNVLLDDAMPTSKSNYMRHTKQWNNRCQTDYKNKVDNPTLSVADISKLKIPKWRHGVAQ